MKRLILISGLLLVFLSVPILSEATSVPIDNPGFEAPALNDGTWSDSIPGWTISGPAGVWNPTDYYFSTSVPEGNNVTWVNSGSISQLLNNYTLTANTDLTLSVDVGWRLDCPMPGYAVQLWAGNNLLASESSTPLVQGGFVTSVLTYNVTDLNPYLGQPLTIVLSKTNGVQANFDNLSFDNNAVPVPEPSTLLLLGSGLVVGYFIRRMRG